MSKKKTKTEQTVQGGLGWGEPTRVLAIKMNVRLTAELASPGAVAKHETKLEIVGIRHKQLTVTLDHSVQNRGCLRLYDAGQEHEHVTIENINIKRNEQPAKVSYVDVVRTADPASASTTTIETQSSYTAGDVVRSGPKYKYECRTPS